MSESYRAILVDGHLHWLDDVPDAIRHGTDELRVRVTVEEPGEESGQAEENGEELASLLEDIAERDPFRDIDDPVAWQRQLRAGSDSD